MAGYYAPTIGTQPRPLPTLAGYMHQRPLPAPYGYGDFQGGNQTTPPMGTRPQVPPLNQPPATTPPQSQPPLLNQPPSTPLPSQVQPNQAALQGSQYTGQVWTPKPPWWRTDAAAYRPIQFPGVKNSGGGRSYYEDGSMVDYGDPAWGRAQGYQPPAAYSDLWMALPDSWKVDLAGRDPLFVQKYLEAVTIGNNAQAQDIYKQSGDYRDQQAQAAAAGKQHPQTEYRDAPYYVPTR